MAIGALGSGSAFLLLLVMLSMDWPYAFAFPGDAVLTGQADLPRDQVEGLVHSVRAILDMDAIYILAWVAAWVGISCFAARRNRLLGLAALVVGLVAPALDTLENHMILSLILDHHQGAPTDLHRLLQWKVVRGLSYLLTFLGAALIAGALHSASRWDRIVSALAAILVLPAAAGLVSGAWEPATILWHLSWFLYWSMRLGYEGLTTEGGIRA